MTVHSGLIDATALGCAGMETIAMKRIGSVSKGRNYAAFNEERHRTPH